MTKSKSKSKRKTVSTQARARIGRKKLVHKLPTLLPRAIKLLELARSMNSGSLKTGEHVAEDLVKTMLAPSSRRKRTGDVVAELIALLLSISIFALQSLISQGRTREAAILAFAPILLLILFSLLASGKLR